jgi:hypothetical protein
VKYLQLRFADHDLHARVKAAAKRARRSMNAQILWMLERQLEQDERNQDDA